LDQLSEKPDIFATLFILFIYSRALGHIQSLMRENTYRACVDENRCKKEKKSMIEPSGFASI